MKSFVLALLLTGCGNSPNNNNSGCTTFGGVCLFPPLDPAARTACGDVTEYCDKTATAAPNLACLASPKLDGSGPATTRLTGFVHVFSSGPDSEGLTIAVYDAAALAGGADPATVTPLASTVAALDPATRRACDRTAANGCSIPSATGCQIPKCNSDQYCRDLGGGNTECSDRLRWEARYTLDNIPTNKQLVIRTSGPAGAWAPLVAWNVRLSTGDRTCEDISATDCMDAAKTQYQLNVNALSRSDYVNIPTSAGLAGGISPGQGAIAGEVHDCDNIRVGNVAVATNPSADRFTYFNGNPIMTLPDSARFSAGTDRLGLFSALNLKPGKVTVQAAGLVGKTLTDFGKFDAYVYPDTVSVMNVNGGKPH
jgi:hypothetical protein